MSKKGFGNVPPSFVLCDVRTIDTPVSGQSMTVYRTLQGKIYSDLDDLLVTYSLDGSEPGLERLKIKLVKPKGSHPEIEPRRGIDPGSVSKVLSAAIKHAKTPEGRLWADMAIASEGKYRYLAEVQGWVQSWLNIR